jgi:hypothetical protein
MRKFFTKSDTLSHKKRLPPHGGGLCCLGTFNQRNTLGGWDMLESCAHVWSIRAHAGGYRLTIRCLLVTSFFKWD